MPANEIRVGGVFVDINANTGQYIAGTNAVQAANARLRASYGTLGGDVARNSLLVQQFGSSLRSSLVATLAYAAGVRAVQRVVSGSVGGFLRYDAALIKIGKTTDLTGRSLARLGERIQAINTQRLGGSRALGVTRDSLLEITEAAGQLGVRGTPELEKFTRAAAALELASSDLTGEEAVIALGRLRAVLVGGDKDVNKLASAIARLGREVAGGEGQVAKFALRIAQEVGGRGGLPTADVLAFGAAFVNAGARAESSGTVIGRVLGAINQLAGDRNLGRFNLLAEAAGDSTTNIADLAESLRDGTGGVQSYGAALTILIRAFSRLPEASAEGLSRSGLRRLLFGDDNVRIAANVGLLSRAVGNLGRLQKISNQALASGNEHLKEGAIAAEGFGSRLTVVGNQIERQGTIVGRAVTPAIVALAENYQALEVGVLAAGAAAAVRFGYVRIVRNLNVTRSAVDAVTIAEKNLLAQRLRLNRVGVVLGTVVDPRARVQAQKAVESQTKRVIAARGRLLVTEQALGTQSKAYTQILVRRSAVAVSVARREVDAANAAFAARTRNSAAIAGYAKDRNAAAGRAIAAERQLATATAATVAASSRRGFAQLSVAQGQLKAQSAVITARKNLGDVERKLAQEGRLLATERIALQARQRDAIKGLTAATAAQAAAQGRLTAATRLGVRAAQFGRGALSFLGGPIGVITTALLLGATAWSLWGNSASAATDKAGQLRDRIDDALKSINEQNSSLTNQGVLIRDIGLAIRGLREEYDTLASFFDENNIVPPPRDLEDQRKELQALQNEIDEYQRKLDIINRGSVADGGTDAAGRANIVIKQFQAINLSLDSAAQRQRAFNREIRDGVDAAIRLARQETALAGESPLAQIRGRLIFQESERRGQRLLDITAAITTARERGALAEQNVARATDAVLTTLVNSKQRTEAEAQEKRAKAILQTETEKLGVLREELNLAEKQTDALERQGAAAVALRNSQVAIVANRPARISFPDRREQLNEAFDFGRDLAADIDRGVRAFEQETAVARQGSSKDRAGLQARFEVENRLADNRTEILRRLSDATREQKDAEEGLTNALRRHSEAAEDLRDSTAAALSQARQRHVDASTEAQDAAALVRATDERAASYRRLADAAEELGRSKVLSPFGQLFKELRADSEDLNTSLKQVGADGVRSLGDELANLVTTGKLNFASLARSIVADLAKVLVKAVIVNNALKALSFLFPGLGIGGIGAVRRVGAFR